MRTFNVTMVSPRGSWIKLAQKLMHTTIIRISNQILRMFMPFTVWTFLWSTSSILTISCSLSSTTTYVVTSPNKPWPVAGVLFAALLGVVKMVLKNGSETQHYI